MERGLAWIGVVWLACGGGDDGSERRDGGVSVADAGSQDAAPPVCPELEPGAGSEFEACNPLTQEGCAQGEKCTRLASGATGCAPDGTVAAGGACARNDESDSCAAGGVCAGGRCRAICTIESDSCCEGFACSSYSDIFDDDPSENAGACEPTCDPVAQDCVEAEQGCYLHLFTGRATCSNVAAGAEELTQGDTCLSGGGLCFVNGCAEGYGGFLDAGDGPPRECTAFCSPIDTYLVDPDGDGEGTVVAGADANGAAPHDCAEATIGVPEHQCRFFQSSFLDVNNEYLDYVPEAYGYCSPKTSDFGDCARFSEEWRLETYSAFVEGGGALENWPDELAARCAERGGCARGCVRVATLEQLDQAWCAAPGNSERPACTDLVGARLRD